MKNLKKISLVLLLLFLCCLVFSCNKNENGNDEGEQQLQPTLSLSGVEGMVIKDHMMQGNIAEVSLYTRQSEQRIRVTLPLISDKEFSSIDVDKTRWNMGDTELLSTFCGEGEEYYGYYIYLIAVEIYYPEKACSMSSLPLVIDGQQTTYEFGTFSIKEYGKDFYSDSDEEDLYYRDNVFEVSAPTIDELPETNLVAEKKVEIKDICISSSELTISEDELQNVLGVREAGEEFPVVLPLDNVKNPRYYCFEMVVDYLTESGEEIAIPAMCPTRNSPKAFAKNVIERILGLEIKEEF